MKFNLSQSNHFGIAEEMAQNLVVKTAADKNAEKALCAFEKLAIVAEMFEEPSFEFELKIIDSLIKDVTDSL